MKHVLIAAALSGLVSLPAAAQFPRLAPPPPCRATLAPTPSFLSPWSDDRRRDDRPKVVVFPFDSEIDDPARVHLAVSLPDRLRRRLAADSRLRLASEGSATRALLEARSLPDSAAMTLDVTYFITGRITIEGGRQEIRVAARRPGQAGEAWQAVFRATSGLRTIEDAVVNGLTRTFIAQSPPVLRGGWPTLDEAHEALLAGDAYLRSTTRQSADSAVVMYERAFRIEPGSAAVASRLARGYVTLLERGGQVPGHPGSAATTRIAALTAQALAADSTSSESWTVRARLARTVDPRRFEGAVEAHRRAVGAMQSDADAEHEFGITVMRQGDARGAEAHFRRALTLEPFKASTLAALSELELRSEHWDAACVFSNASIAAWPYDPLPYAVRARARLRLADARNAYSDAELVRRLSAGAWTDALRVLVAQGAGNVDMAGRLATQLTASWLASGGPLSVRDAEYLALAYVATGDQRRAVVSLQRAQPVGADLGVVLNSPALAPVRSDSVVVRMLRDLAARPGGAARGGATPGESSR